MTKINNDSLAVAALKNGTVIDRINPEVLFKVADLLDIKAIKTSVTIGVNLDSKKMGKKGIIKVADTYFTQETLNRIALALNCSADALLGTGLEAQLDLPLLLAVAAERLEEGRDGGQEQP